MANRKGSGWLWDSVLWIAASPVYALFALPRMARRVRLARITVQQSMPCRTCGREVSLIGFWRCGCGFTYRGHLLRLCPVCGTLPELIRCEHCGATEKVPC